jgi:CubicO group peptidase (beta-lactamase class C family)
MRFILYFALFLVIPATAQIKVGVPVSGKKTDKTLAALDKLFASSLTAFNVPGMAVAIVQNDEVIFSKGYGVANVSTNEPVTDETVFAIASNSKAYTAAALATLVDQGKLKWDDKVRKYLPEFELYDPYVSNELTVRDLLCHRSGLATFSGDVMWYGSSHSRAEVLRRARYLEPVSGFRAQFGYQNILFLAAGEIIPAVTGKSWDEYIAKQFFSPLGMTRTSTSILNLPGNGVAAPHNEVKGKLVPIPWVNWDNIGPAGSINSSVKDHARWIRLQLGKGTLEGREYWKAARTDEMWENNTPVRVSNWQRHHMPSRHFNGYGLGWQLMEYRGEKVVSHGGGYDGFISQTVMVPGKNLGFVILTNSNNSLPSCLMFEVLDAYLGGSEESDWVNLFLGYKKSDEEATETARKEDLANRKMDTRPSLPLSEYCGTYTSELYGDVEVAPGREDQGGLELYFKPTPLHDALLSHWHYDTFELTWQKQHMLPPGKATFVLDAQGKVTELKIVVDNPDLDFTELKLVRQ